VSGRYTVLRPTGSGPEGRAAVGAASASVRNVAFLKRSVMNVAFLKSRGNAIRAQAAVR